ncbi:MAG: XRE family transcriptional regulator [Rhodobacteraceae bacterium]|nr:XRE family transcriptional regulator [Paracoccaceae bacterium]
MENIRPIKTDDDLAWAIADVDQYFHDVPEPGTPAADRFDVLPALIEDYENKYHPIAEPDPIELLKSFMETTGRTQAEFAKILGSRSRASEVLKCRRALTLTMIRNITREWLIPADSLIAPYHLEQ